MNETEILSTMLPLKQRLQRIQKEKGVNWEIVELDYTLSWVLAAIGESTEIRDELIFKGGTCLKKCYFGKAYRFSQDLDFTTRPEILDQTLDEYINKVVMLTYQLANSNGIDLEVIAEPYKEKQPHPFNQKAYILRARLPWQREPMTKIKFEISRDEKILVTPKVLPILHEYGEEFSQQLKTYALEEIVAEKYRGILQNQERLKERKWVRSRVRDFFDLWCILTKFKQTLNLANFRELFVEKCSIKNIEFTGAGQFFENKTYLEKIEKDWGEFLGNLILDLPSFDNLIIQLKKLTDELFDK